MIFNLITKAKDLFFNKTGTNLEADNVQDAITEINNDLSSLIKTTTFQGVVDNLGRIAIDIRHDKLLNVTSSSGLFVVSGTRVDLGNTNKSLVFLKDSANAQTLNGGTEVKLIIHYL